MKIEKVLISEIKKINGNLLGIGSFKEDILVSIEKNKNILFCDILSNSNFSTTSNKSSKGKEIFIDEMKKKYKKKNINFIICNFNDIKNCFPVFFRDVFSIYKNKLYLFINKAEKIPLENKLKKLEIKYVKKEDQDNFLYIIESKKINIVKNILMYLQNKAEIFGDIISEILNK